MVSNDKYEGHCPSSANGNKKAFRDWLKRVRKGYEFDVAKLDIHSGGEKEWPNRCVEWKYCTPGWLDSGLKMSTRLGVVVHGPRRRPGRNVNSFRRRRRNDGEAA